MTLMKALAMVEAEYKIAKASGVNNPLAYALRQVLKVAEEKGSVEG